MEWSGQLPDSQATIEVVLMMAFGHIRFAGVLYSANMILTGIALHTGWKGFPSRQARMELLYGIWMLRIFLFPLG